MAISINVYMLGTYVMHLDIQRDDDDDYGDGESSNEDYFIIIIYRYPSAGTMKLGKTQKYGQRPSKNCNQFLVK